jgi:hypothetical protein
MSLPLDKQDATPVRVGTVRYSELRQALVKDAKVSLTTSPSNFGHAMLSRATAADAPKRPRRHCL